MVFVYLNYIKRSVMKQKIVGYLIFLVMLFVAFRVVTNSHARKNCQEAYNMALQSNDAPVDYHFSSGLWGCKCRVN